MSDKNESEGKSTLTKPAVITSAWASLLKNIGVTLPCFAREEIRRTTSFTVNAAHLALDSAAEQKAFEQTLGTHYVLIGAEHDVMVKAIDYGRSTSEEDNRREVGDIGALTSFIPKQMLRCIQSRLVYRQQWKVLLDSPYKSVYQPILARFPSAVVFADASGFTKLTESLSRQAGGGQLIGKTLSDFFGPIIDLVHKHGGDIFKFSGDALTIIWPATDPAPEKNFGNLLRRQLGNEKKTEAAISTLDAASAARKAIGVATQFCIEAQQLIPTIGKTPVDGHFLTMHIGVGFGDLALLQVGGLLNRWEYCVAGAALDQIAIAEPLAESGETVLSPQAKSFVEDVFDFELVADAKYAKEGFAKLIGQKADRADVKWEHAKWWNWDPSHEQEVDMQLLERFLPQAVTRQRKILGSEMHSARGRKSSLDAIEEQSFPAEMRRVSVIFLSVMGIDASKDCNHCPADIRPKSKEGAREAQLLMRLLQRSVYALEGSVNKFLVDDKGVLLLVVFGLPPLIHYMDDPIRSVLCAMRFSETLREEGLTGRIGVATGYCWCGVVGSPLRREYTVLGDVVNLSARLMGKAKHNTILVDSYTYQKTSHLFLYEAGIPLTLKGKARPVEAFCFKSERKAMLHTRRLPQPSLLSWDAWPARQDLFRALESQSNSGIVFITGAGGAGKSALAEEVKAWAARENWVLLSGQNLDPSETFAVPKLCVQEVYRELVKIASAQPMWRQKAAGLLSDSLGYTAKDIENIDSITLGPPSHSELYWMLVAMVERSVGEDCIDDYMPWMPLLNLVVTQLSFGHRMVQAMKERDEQHVRHNRFAEVATAVLDGFSRECTGHNGVLVLCQLHRSSAYFQRNDDYEIDLIKSIARLCLRSRNETSRDKPNIMICIIAREALVKQSVDSVVEMAREIGGFVQVNDLDFNFTHAMVRHLLDTHPQQRESSVKSRSLQDIEKAVKRSSIVPEDSDIGVLTEYIYRTTGGSPGAIHIAFEHLVKHCKLNKVEDRFVLTEHCTLRKELEKLPVPPQLDAMAFGVFESCSPEQQAVLKAMAAIEWDVFDIEEVQAALPNMSATELENIIYELRNNVTHAVRQVESASDGTEQFQIYSSSLKQVCITLMLEAQKKDVRVRATESHNAHERFIRRDSSDNVDFRLSGSTRLISTISE